MQCVLFALISPDRLIVQKTLVNTNTIQLILNVRILINQTLHKPDSQTQDQSVVFSPRLSFSPSTCLSSSNLTGLEPWTSRSCPQQFWRPGKRNPARLGRPVPGCCYLSQLCSLCSLLGYNLTKGKVKSLNSCRWVFFLSVHVSSSLWSNVSKVTGLWGRSLYVKSTRTDSVSDKVPYWAALDS